VIGRIAFPLAMALLLIAGLAGCASVEVSPPIKSCHTYSIDSKYLFNMQCRVM
jgi:hypothetical protein